jgi:hypothetical protein
MHWVLVDTLSMPTVNKYTPWPLHRAVEICDVVLRGCWQRASFVPANSIQGWTFEDIRAASLAYLMEQCQSLEALTLEDLQMDNSCRALGAYSSFGDQA